ncbi:hypothetical protein V8C35DRAFT_20529 [Trichoderma chlorosporum]
MRRSTTIGPLLGRGPLPRQISPTLLSLSPSLSLPLSLSVFQQRRKRPQEPGLDTTPNPTTRHQLCKPLFLVFILLPALSFKLR